MKEETPCVCGCEKDTHRHFYGAAIRLTYCGRCGAECKQYRAKRWWRR